MRLHNTLSKLTEEFKPIKGKTVRMYNCGPTVYNYAHIGNLRAFVFADIVKRALIYSGYSVKQIMNITDVGHLTSDADTGEDKVEQEAKKEHKTAKEVADFYTEAFFEDIEKLNISTKGTKFPRATEHILEQIDLIQTLADKNYTYTTSDGVYFDTSKFPEYGKLGKINLAGLEEGVRIGPHAEKKNITDFALWKFSKPEDKRQQEWDSPWGRGFPGWHIECSAMSMKYLGETFDIHTGGVDHIPVHHNNEIAQSESATGKQYVKYWMHNEFVQVSGEKMAKSEGNFIRLKILEDQGVHPLAYRYWLLIAHFQSPVMFSLEAVEAAQTALEDIILKIISLYKVSSRGSSIEQFKKEFDEAIANNLNTPQAIAVTHKTLNDPRADKNSATLVVKTFDQVLGLDLEHLAQQVANIPKDVLKIQKSRDTLRATNKWVEADSLRKEIEKQGYIVRDAEHETIITRPLASLISRV